MTPLELIDLTPKMANETVVALLKEWLEDAQSGKLQAVAIAGLTADGSITTASTGTNASRGSVTQAALLGAIHRLMFRVADF